MPARAPLVPVRCLLVIVTLGACARGGAVQDDVDGGPGAPTGTDAAALDAPGPVPPGDAPSGVTPARLLLTEVVLAPSTGELIEIANLGTTAVDLSTYYLADTGLYFQLPGGAPTIEASDFIVRFPAGAAIPAGGVVTVALDTAASFATEYGSAPSHAIAGGAMVRLAGTGVASLTNSGELIVLFQWDGATDLVRDVDMVLVGLPTAANGMVDKSGIAVDGPDADSTATAYAPDARTLGAQAAAPAAGRSTKRTSLETGHELQAGAGNGLAGDDETSEDTATTWDSTFTVPTPGTIPTALLP